MDQLHAKNVALEEELREERAQNPDRIRVNDADIEFGVNAGVDLEGDLITPDVIRVATSRRNRNIDAEYNRVSAGTLITAGTSVRVSCYLHN